MAGHSAADSDQEVAVTGSSNREARDTGEPKIKVDVNVSLPREEHVEASERSSHSPERNPSAAAAGRNATSSVVQPKPITLEEAQTDYAMYNRLSGCRGNINSDPLSPD